MFKAQKFTFTGNIFYAFIPSFTNLYYQKPAGASVRGFSVCTCTRVALWDDKVFVVGCQGQSGTMMMSTVPPAAATPWQAPASSPPMMRPAAPNYPSGAVWSNDVRRSVQTDTVSFNTAIFRHSFNGSSPGRYYILLLLLFLIHSVLRRCRLGDRKSIRPVKNLAPAIHKWRAPWKNRTSLYISFYRPSLNGVLFPMFCLLVEVESDFSVLKYYKLNINYLVNILNECLCILIDCSQLSAKPASITCCSVVPPEKTTRKASEAAENLQL